MRPSTRQVASMSHLAVAAGVVGEPGRVLAPVGPTDAPWGKSPAPLPTRHGKVRVTARGVRRNPPTALSSAALKHTDL